MKPENYSIWDKMAITFGLKRDWQVIQQKSKYKIHFYVNSYGGKYGEREVLETFVIEECSITGNKRARVIYGPGSLFCDYNIDPVAAKAQIDLMD